MIKEFFAKLIAWREKETNFAKKRFMEESAKESRRAAGRERDQKARMKEEDEKRWEEIPLPNEPIEKPEKSQE